MTLRFTNTLAALLSATALLGACASKDQPDELAAANAITPTEQYAIEVVPSADEILLAPHGALSPAQSSALGELAMRWTETGEGPVVVRSLPDGPGRDTAMQAVQALQAYGVPAQSVQFTAAEPPADPAAPPAPVRVGFEKLAAVIPHCGGQWGEMTRTGRNLPYSGFGCAVTANMAAQIASPGDLVTPRPGAPADADRRAAVIDKYRKGEPTGAKADGAERGVVSRTIQ